MGLANKLTILRVLFIPFFMYFFFSEIAWGVLLSLLVFVLASLTDSLDGYVARKYNQVTNFGKIMDPLVDKLLISAVLVSFVDKHYLPSWMAVVIISREFIITGVRIVAVSERKIIAAGIWGKIKTVSQIIVIIMILLNVWRRASPFEPSGFDQIIYFAELLTVAFTVYSGVDYIIKNRDLFG